jgi:hypothetical protein
MTVARSLWQARSVVRHNILGRLVILSLRNLQVSGRSILVNGVVWLVGAGLAAGCGARTANVVSPAGPATRVYDKGTMSRGISARVEAHNRENERHHNSPAIVIGFVGGFVKRGDAVHSPVQVAQRLGKAYRSGVHVEIFENRHRDDAYRRVLELLDAEHIGKPSDAEKRDAKIIIYGMSWGGSETVALARELKEQNIPVLLTVQVDSVAKLGQNDEVIPANVAEAANFYQTDGLLHGRARIRAEEATRTRILGNFHYEYKAKSLSCSEYPWYDRFFTKYHTQIECDPEVWHRVEMLIRDKLPFAEHRSVMRGSPSQD